METIMIKKPIKTTPIYTLPEGYELPVDGSALARPGKTRMLTSFLLNDINKNLKLTCHKVERIARSKAGLRRVITIRKDLNSNRTACLVTHDKLNEVLSQDKKGGSQIIHIAELKPHCQL